MANINKLNISEYLREIVYGGTDGIITTFAVVAGFSGANIGEDALGISIAAVLLFGLANLFADATSMGLGNFLSIRSEKKVYANKKAEQYTKLLNSQAEMYAATKEILVRKGFTEKTATCIADAYKENKDYWLEFIMNDKLKLSNPDNTNPFYTALATFFAFIFFGSIPLLPYIVETSPENGFLKAILTTLIALFTLGLLRWKVTNEKFKNAIFEIVILGSVSASIGYFVGYLFK